METYQTNKESFEGFETWFNAFKMKYKMHSRILLFLVILVLTVFLLSICATYDSKTDIAGRWLVAKTMATVKPSILIAFKYGNGSTGQLSVGTISKTPWIRNIAIKEIKRLSINLLKICTLLLFYPLIISSFKKRSSKQSGKKYIRGAKFATKQDFFEKAKKRKEKLDIPFGEIKQPVLSEPKHTFIAGKPGSGKTVCMCQVLNRIKQRGNKGIIYDFKGDYLAKFYDPSTDLIFNPLDRRSLGWNLFNELKTKMDIDANTASLIPDDPKEVPFWAVGARSVLAGIFHNLYQNNMRTNRDIWEAVVEDAPQLVNRLSLTDGGQAGHRFVGNGESNQALGVLAKLMQHTLCFQYMADNEGDFSVGDWLYDDKPGMIFITNYADIKDTLKPILTLFVDTVGRKLLTMPDKIDRRVFFLLDEFNTLQKMPTLIDMLTLSRSKGGSIYIGVQDYGKIDSIYTKELRQSIVNACSNSVIFTLSDEAAKTASKGMDEVQYMESTKTYNMGVHNWRDGISLNEKKEKEPLMLPAEIEQLPDMRGVVKFANYNRIITNWYDPKQPTRPNRIFPDRNTPFEIRPELNLENILAEQQRIMDELNFDADIPIEEEGEEPPQKEGGTHEGEIKETQETEG